MALNCHASIITKLQVFNFYSHNKEEKEKRQEKERLEIIKSG